MNAYLNEDRLTQMRMLRKSAKLSQQAMSVLLGVTRETVVRWEMGVKLEKRTHRMLYALMDDAEANVPGVLRRAYFAVQRTNQWLAGLRLIVVAVGARKA